MAEKTENLVLEHLRAIRGQLDVHSKRFDEVMVRLRQIETGVSRVRRDQVDDAETVVGMQAMVDRLSMDVDTIKRRLDIIGAEGA